MPNKNFVVSGYVYDLNGTDKVTSGNVFATNYSQNNETIVASVNDIGEYAINIGNLTTDWSTNDIIYIYYIGNNKNAVARIKMLSTETVWDTDLYTKPGSIVAGFANKDYLIDGKRASAVLKYASLSSTAMRLWIIERHTDTPLYIETTSSAITTGQYYGDIGIQMKQGFYTMLTSTSESPLIQSAGLGNAIGDITKRVASATYSVPVVRYG